jgi:hypothetical protein
MRRLFRGGAGAVNNTGAVVTDMMKDYRDTGNDEVVAKPSTVWKV